MSQVVGTAFVRLRLLTDTIGKDIKQSIEKSDLQDINIKVKADTAEAMTKLGLLDKEAQGLDGKEPKINPKVDTKDSQKQIGLLSTAIGLLGPTIGPLAGAATAAFGGLAAGAGVALLALQGVKSEMKKATDTGVAFQSGLQTLKGDLSTLETTAAKAVLPGFQETVASLNGVLPQVNRSVSILGRELGDIGSHVVVGLVAGLQTFEPLLLHVGQAADIAARHFQDWSTGPGGAKFAQSLGQAFDQVVPVLVNLVQAVAKLVAAFAPIGSQVVGIIGALASAINAVPLPVLKALADVFVALYAANKLMTVFGNLSIALRGMAVSSELAGTKLGGLASSAAGLTKFAGTAAAAGFAVYSIGKSISNFLESGNAASKVFDNMGAANSNFYNSLIQSKGALDDTVTSSVQYQLAQDGLTNKAAKAGISQDQLTKAITGTDDQTKALVDTWKASGKPSGDTIVALYVLHQQYEKAAAAAALYNAQQQQLINSPAWGALKTTKDSTQQVADKFDIAASTVKNYAELLGISATAVKNGVVTNQQLADAVLQVQSAYTTADAAGSQFLAALQKFSDSTGSAADRAQLIGAYLKAAQGDALGYAGAVSSAYAASQNLVNSFDKQQRAAINLKTGLIDVTKAGAGPLIQSLQGMQTAAENAAIATYQHEVAEKGAGQAASDAATIFKNQTYTALVDNARQLGLTKDQATALANQYFQMPKDIATRVRALGTNDVVNVLNQIGQQLSYLTGHAWVPTVIANTGAAISSIQRMQNALNALNGKTVSTYVYTNYITVGNKQQAGSAGTNLANRAKGGLIQYRASGGPSGMVTGPGTGTSDTAGLYALSNGEYVINAVSTARYLPLIKAINAQGMAGGGIASTSGGSDMPTGAQINELIRAVYAIQNPVVMFDTTKVTQAINTKNLRNARLT